MLYTPECFVKYPDKSPAGAGAVAAKAGASAAKGGEDKKKSTAGDGETTAAAGGSADSASAGTKSEPSSAAEKSKGAAAGDKDKDKNEPSSSSSSPKKDAGERAAATGDGVKKDPDGDGDVDDDDDDSSAAAAAVAAERKPRPVYYGVDQARKRVALKCTSCGMQGALIGCHVQSCSITTHFTCARREGWKFGDEPDADGKLFLCGMHREQGQVRFERKAPAKKAARKSGESCWLATVPWCVVFFSAAVITAATARRCCR